MDPTTSTIFNLPNNQPFRDASEAITRGSDYPNRYRHEDQYVERDGKHKGVGGAARGILGFLGDLLLTRLHMPAQFGPGEQRRKMAAAQQGFDIDPESAINRVASIDPVMGMKMREQQTDNQRIAAQNAATNEARQSRTDLQKEQQNQVTRTYAASMLGSMATWPEDKRAANWPTMRNQVIVAGKRRNIDLSEELPEQYDPVTVDAFIDGAVPVGTQRTQRLAGDRIEATTRGQDIRSADTRRGQDIRSADTKSGQGVTMRGQDIRSDDTKRGQDITVRGQDIKAETTTRGQDIRSTDTKRGQDIRSTDTKRGQDVRNPIRQQTINGVKYNFKLVGKDWVNIGPAK